MADEGEDITEHLVKKYGQRVATNFGNPDSYLDRAGREVGIQFTSDRNVYPTIKAHALMEHVKKTDNDKANQIMEKMYHLYLKREEILTASTFWPILRAR
jgi:predicted DsbA family dithiol-disulfide isomerase